MNAVTITRVRQFYDGDIWIGVRLGDGYDSPYSLNDYFRLGYVTGDQREEIERLVSDVLVGRCEPPSPKNPYQLKF